MVRDSRIKEYNYSKIINAATTGSFYSDSSINGTVKELNFTFGTAGSITVAISGTDETIYSTKDVSGAGYTIKRPIAYTCDNAGAVAIGSPSEEYLVNGPIKFVLTGMNSGTKPLYINVKYI